MLPVMLDHVYYLCNKEQCSSRGLKCAFSGISKQLCCRNLRGWLSCSGLGIVNLSTACENNMLGCHKYVGNIYVTFSLCGKIKAFVAWI